MKSHFLIAVIGLAMGLQSALAQQDHEAHHPPADPVPVERAAPDAAPPMMEKMMERMERMQADMDQLAQTQDPTERQELIEAHKQRMHEFSGMMRAMHKEHHGDGMKGGHGMKKGPGKGMKHPDGHMMMMGMMEAYRQMDKRLDLMQAVIENFLLKE